MQTLAESVQIQYTEVITTYVNALRYATQKKNKVRRRERKITNIKKINLAYVYNERSCIRDIILY